MDVTNKKPPERVNLCAHTAFSLATGSNFCTDIAGVNLIRLMSQLTGKLASSSASPTNVQLPGHRPDWHKAGARLAFTYQGERLKENVEELPALLDRTPS